MAPFIVIGFFALCEAIWKQIRRNAMTPEELAQFEEDQEHESWMRAFFREPEPSLAVGIAAAVVVLLGFGYFLFYGLPA